MLHQMKALWYMPGAMGWGIITIFFLYTIDEMILKLYRPAAHIKLNMTPVLRVVALVVMALGFLIFTF